MVLSLLLSTFLTVFIAELGDKTQLATLTISGTSNKPLAVFLGSSSALVIASLLGALTGGSISNFLPEVILKSIASITFFVIGIRLFLNSFSIIKEENEAKENN
jgi:putative Ca2+/H+ antiporter (TMEM165/GDT1 family)